jgi:hypothetical protein
MAHLGCNANNASLSSVPYHHDLWQTGKEKKHQTITPGMKEHVFYVVWIAVWTIGAFVLGKFGCCPLHISQCG